MVFAGAAGGRGGGTNSHQSRSPVVVSLDCTRPGVVKKGAGLRDGWRTESQMIASFAQLVAFDGVVFAGVAGGRGGGAGCHNAASFMRHYTRPGGLKKGGGGRRGRVAGGTVPVNSQDLAQSPRP